MEGEAEEKKARERAKVTADLRKLIEYVCGQRLVGVPEDLAAVLHSEENLLLLSRWYIGASTLSAEDLTTLVHAPRPG